MTYVVTARELKWAGRTLLRGAEVQPQNDRDHKHIDLLAKIGKVGLKPEGKPVRHASTVKPPVHTAALKAEQPEEPAAPEAQGATQPVEPVGTDEAEALVPRTYRTRRLKSED